jgi:hypothetical protein
VEGAGIHHNPTPGPAGKKHLYGHVWVVLAALAKHPDWGTLALPLQGQLYIRAGDIDDLPLQRKRSFQTKLELAAQQLRWLKPWVGHRFEQFWVVVDGGYAKKPFLAAAQQEGWVVVSRLRKDAALFSVPPPRQPGQRGRPRIYGEDRISLAKRAGQQRGWQEVQCVQYGQKVTKQVKRFLATWRPAGGVIVVVLVKEDDGWLAFFCLDVGASAAEVLAAMADRGALEQTNKDVKEVGAALPVGQPAASSIACGQAQGVAAGGVAGGNNRGSGGHGGDGENPRVGRAAAGTGRVRATLAQQKPRLLPPYELAFKRARGNAFPESTAEVGHQFLNP